jgi:peroxiredoxin
MASRVSKRARLIIVILTAAVLVAVGIAVGYGFSDPSDSTPQGQEAPDFTLPTTTGANVTLSGQKGTPVVLNFWSISCTYCRQQLPYLENIAQQRGEEMKVIAINMANSAVSVQNFFDDYEPTMIVALDENREVFVTYCQNFNNARAYIPFTLFVDSEGIVKYVKIGAFASETQLRDTIASVF